VPSRSAPYLSPVTHHFGFWDQAQEASVWMPYHFFPAASGGSKRRDGRISPWRVVPDSPPVKELLVSALRTDDPYRIGIALHTYADSWAHQEFTGRRDDFNALPGILGIPPLGHAQAERLPDLFQAKWRDARLVDPEVDNRRRFLAAARRIYRYLAVNRRRPFADEELVLTELELLLGPEEPAQAFDTLGSTIHDGINRGLKGMRNLAARFGATGPASGNADEDSRFPRRSGRSDAEMATAFAMATGLPDPDRQAWRRAALVLPEDDRSDEESASINDKISWLRHELLTRAGYTPQTVEARSGFEDSHFWRWCEAARAHAAAAAAIIKQIG
jgi:hypothetical protein